MFAPGTVAFPSGGAQSQVEEHVMSDDLRSQLGAPTDDDGADGSKVEDKGTARIDEEISDDPAYEEDGVAYDPAAQTPK